MANQIDITDEQRTRPLSDTEVQRIVEVVDRILQDHGVEDAEMSIAVLDDQQIQVYNRKYLQHDFPTDVISFVLSDEAESLHSQLLISRQTADLVAEELPWDGDTELLLYSIHGTLHCLGYQDDTLENLAVLRNAERKYLQSAGIQHAHSHPHFDDRNKITDIVSN